MHLSIPTAKVFEPLLSPSRYKGAYGGRGSGKSHFFAEMIIDYALRWPGDTGEGLRVLCFREIQKSLKQSAKFLIEKKLGANNIGGKHGFHIYGDRIVTPKDGVIEFTGMQDHTADSVKSYEGFHIAWGEEAQSITANSLGLLRPTIRWENKSLSIYSEIWLSWNPRRKNDAVDVLLRSNPPRSDAIVVRANWDSNPWFPDVLTAERLECRKSDPDNYAHIWEGDYIKSHKGAYYADHISRARKEGRIGVLSYEPLLPYKVFIDIGGAGAKSDAFTMWVCQFVGSQIRVLDYYEAQGQEAGEHLAWLRSNGYVEIKTKIHLPHDGRTSEKLSSNTYEGFFKRSGYTTEVYTNKSTGIAKVRVETAKRLFPSMWFNKKKTQAGLDALGWYHEKWDDERNIGLGPEHDWSSHAADSFGLMALMYRDPYNNTSRPTRAISEYSVFG